MISLFESDHVVVFNPKNLYLIAASVANAAAFNSNHIKILLANGLSTFFIKSKLLLYNGLESLPKNPPDCPSFCSWVFDNFILADELFANALWIFETCVLVNNNLCSKLVSSLESPTTFD